jgi:hypothetical protein
LAVHFDRDIGAYEQSRQVVQDCFPQLNGTCILSSYVVGGVATVPVASKPFIEDTKNDGDVILLSREDVEIDDKTTNKAKMPSTILPESNIASNDVATSNNDDNSNNGDSKPSAHPKNNVASNAMNDSQGCVSSLTTSNVRRLSRYTLPPKY